MPRRYQLPALVAGAAVTLAACGSDGPRWAKGADQIDIAAWEAICGKERYAMDDSGPSANFPLHEERFNRPSPAHPGPDMPLVSCAFSRHLNSQRLFRVNMSAVGREETEITPDLQQAFVALLEDVLPASVHPALHAVAASPAHVKRSSHGFHFEGGKRPGAAPGTIWWELSVSTSR